MDFTFRLTGVRGAYQEVERVARALLRLITRRLRLRTTQTCIV